MTGFNSKRDAAADKLQEPAQLTEKEKISREMTAEIAAARALAQPAQEPAEWSWVCNECGAHEFLSSVSESDLKFLSCGGCGCDEFHKENITPPQREWVGLTDIDIAMAFDGVPQAFNDKLKFARAIEQALKEKNT